MAKKLGFGLPANEPYKLRIKKAFFTSASIKTLFSPMAFQISHILSICIMCELASWFLRGPLIAK